MMRLLFFLLCFSLNISYAQTYTLVWADEFNYSGLPDSTKWGYDVGGQGWGNNEDQFYTRARKKNARVENGHLIIEAIKENYENKSYTSARLVTKGKAEWQYGKIDVRAKIPDGRGTWPAIWMLRTTMPLKWPDNGEIDIMEHVGYDPGVLHGSVHCKKYYHTIGTQKTASIPLRHPFNQFHIYGVEWDKEKVQVSLDGNPYFQFKNEHNGYEAWPFDNKMYLLLNLAVGGNWGGAKGVDESIWPKRMEIDYVRVFQKINKNQ